MTMKESIKIREGYKRIGIYSPTEVISNDYGRNLVPRCYIFAVLFFVQYKHIVYLKFSLITHTYLHCVSTLSAF